ncbi:MAG: arginyl-tRNA synthetase, partial [Patescibacteria group bacterium]|nr:arginyl-tRNA synthetase [Patescibacteria group bacterium]
IVLVDNRQSFHCKQLQAVLQKLPAESFPHAYGYADYGLLTLKEGAMSSRKGNVVTYQELRDSVVAYAVEQTRARHADWDEEAIQRTAHAIALGGMKFALLKQDPNTIFTFDREQALAFEGVTGPYCQYAVVRLQGILSRAQGLAYQDAPLAMDDAWTPAERELLLAVSRLTDIVVTASGVQLDGIIDATKTNPSVLAQWCFSTAQLINAFYRDVPVMDAEGDVRLRRLALAFAAKRALTNGLSFLTIPVPERM